MLTRTDPIALKAYQLGRDCTLLHQPLPTKAYSPIETIAIEHGYAHEKNGVEKSLSNISIDIHTKYEQEEIILICNKRKLQEKINNLSINHEARYAYKVSEINSLLWSAQICNKKYEIILFLKKSRFFRKKWLEYFKDLAKKEYFQ